MIYRKALAIVTTVALFSISTSASASGIRVSAGSLPGITGFENAYLTDRFVSGEGSGSEEVFMDYSGANTTDNQSAIFISMPFSDSGSSVGLVELGVAFGDATTYQLSVNYQYNIFQPSANSAIHITPLLGYASITQDMGEVPVFNGQINTDDGDFNSGDTIEMATQGFVAGIRFGFDYEVGNIAIFANVGYQIGILAEPTVSITQDGQDTELTGQLHAKNCTGTSSVNLECGGYFNPFEDVAGLSGPTFQIGARF